MKKLINQILRKYGYQIKKIDNGFSFNSNLDWLKEYNIKTVFDIGANEGQFASYINSQLPNSIIYSFEPIKECYLRLEVLKKDIDKLFPLNNAFGDSNCVMEFNVNHFTHSSSFLSMEEECVKNFPTTKNSTKENVEMKVLDNIFENLEIEKEVLVKIDVQGFEDRVIRGGERFFKEIPKIVIIEASIVKLYKNEASFEELFDKFRSLGYNYKGNLYQLYSSIDGKILQVDAIFFKN